MRALRRKLIDSYLSHNGNALQHFKKLLNWQWLSYEQLHDMQCERLIEILSYAYRHVPYYRRVLEQTGVINRSGTIRLERFSQIPLLEKQLIHDNFGELTSDDIDQRTWFDNSSSGSTGEPVKFIQDKQYAELNESLKMLFDTWTGYFPGAKKTILWGSDGDPLEGIETIKRRLGRLVRNELPLNVSGLTTVHMKSYMEKINGFKPELILAYATSLYVFSRFIERNDLSVYSPHAIMTSAEMLYPEMRATIQRVFDAPVFNRYGSREVGSVACECDQHAGLHASMLTHHVEILKPDGTPALPGELGELVVTPLANYAMPLIRYRIKDLAAWSEEPCTCGRSWPLLKELDGRVADMFLLRDGGFVAAASIAQAMGGSLDGGWIKKYQVIQEDYEAINIFITPHDMPRNPNYAHELQDMSNNIKTLMGKACRVEFRFVEDIPTTASGKHRYFISKLSGQNNTTAPVAHQNYPATATAS